MTKHLHPQSGKIPMLATILIILLVGIAALGVVISMQPDNFRYSRSVVIDAPPSVVYPYISDLKKGSEWSPWVKLDPNIKETYEGPTNKVGGVYKWSGDRNVGEGVITILELHPNELARMKLDFIKPFKGTNTIDYALTPQDNKTLMTWSMYGPNTFIGKTMGLIMNCEKMIGDRFDKGLADLKTMVESQHAKH